VYFNVNFNVFFRLIKVHLLVSGLYIYQNARCNDKKKLFEVLLPCTTCSVKFYSSATTAILQKQKRSIFHDNVLIRHELTVLNIINPLQAILIHNCSVMNYLQPSSTTTCELQVPYIDNRKPS